MANLNTFSKQALLDMLKSMGYDGDLKLTRIEIINKIKELDASRAVLNVPAEKENVPKGFVVSNDPIVADKLADTTVKPQETVEPNISPSDPGWTDYVMGLLTEDEKYDGFPTCDGLRRIFELLVGEITDVDMSPMQVPNNENGGRATVKCTITYMPIVGNNIKSISDVADCYYGNTAQPYVKHPSATAATMAEGRCLRKGLRIRTLVREENMGPKGAEAELATEIENGENIITENQRHTIQRLCERLNISVDKFIESEPVKGKTLFTLTYAEAQLVLRSLSAYQRPILQGGKEIPASILKNTGTPSANS